MRSRLLRAANDGGDGVLPWFRDVRRLLHVHERDLCGDSDLPGRNLHGGAHLLRVGCDLFAEPDLPVLSDLRGYRDLFHGDLCRLADLSRFDHVLRGADLRQAADI